MTGREGAEGRRGVFKPFGLAELQTRIRAAALRRKLGVQWLIETVYGPGFRLAAEG